MPYYFTIEQSHKEEKRIDEELEKEFPNLPADSKSQIKIHFDYCNVNFANSAVTKSVKSAKKKRTIDFEWNVEKSAGKAVYKIMG